VSGDVLEVAAPSSKAGAGDGEPGAQREASERLLADGVITETEFAALQPNGPTEV
jgi:hypothetical protein